MDYSYLEAARPIPARSRDPEDSGGLCLKAGIEMERRRLSPCPLPAALCSAGRRSRGAGTGQSEPGLAGCGLPASEGVAGRLVRVP